MATKKWYTHDTNTGWHKSQSPDYRRRLALKAHGGDYLSTARGLQALANVTKDKATERAARADAKYFFAMNKKHNK
jgi:hypothetical protein